MMGARGVVRRLWNRVLHRKRLGRIVIKFYPPGRLASITLSPSLETLSRHDWHWLYLQHLAESLEAIEEQEAVRLRVAARALAEDFVSSSYWPQMIGEKISDAMGGASEVIPEQPGGTALVVEVMRRGREIPGIRLEWPTPGARERLASSNLVLLVHVMRGAAHPLEHYQLFKKITLFAEYCERVGHRHDRTTLKTGPLYAVVHADIADIMLPASRSEQHRTVPLGVIGTSAEERTAHRPDRPAPALHAQAPPPPDRVSQPDRRLWDRPGVAISAAVILWVGLIVSAFLIPRHSGLSPVSLPNARVLPVPGTHEAVQTQDPATAAKSAAVSPSASEPRRTLPQATGRAGDGSRVRRSAAQPAARPEGEQSGLPRFRVVSGMLARDVAELRSRTLAEQGADAFVRSMSGNVAQLQYGAYRSWMNAEAEAWRLRAQGYTAVIVPW